MEVHEILTRTISCTLSAWCKSTATSWGCCLASDWHAADTGSIPLCGKGFFSQSQLTEQTHWPPCTIACINICAHVKDPVVHDRVQWIMETLKHPACTIGWAARLLHLAFPGESNLYFPWEKSHWDNTDAKKKVLKNCYCWLWHWRNQLAEVCFWQAHVQSNS